MPTKEDLPEWMKVLTDNKPEVLQWPVTKLFYPGTHDTGTYGLGEFPTDVARFNWHCQKLNIYEQAKIGVRYFDLRLQNIKSEWWPHHDIALKTGDVFAHAGKEEGKHTIAGQLLQFVKEHPTELIILAIDQTPGNDTSLSELIQESLGGKSVFLESPDATKTVPTIEAMRNAHQNFVLSGHIPSDPQSSEFLNQYLWHLPGEAFLDSLYDEPIWKSNDPSKVKSAIDDWIQKNQAVLEQRSHLWNAQCQLTPSVNNVQEVLESAFEKQWTSSPEDLAKVMNPFVRDVVVKDEVWRKCASVLTVDIANEETVLSIVEMNWG